MISIIMYLFLARAAIVMSIGIPLHVLIDRYLYKYNNKTRMIDRLHPIFFDDKDPTKEPTSVLSKIISRINYLLLTRSKYNPYGHHLSTW